MTAHKTAASLLAVGPDMHPVGMNPAVNTLQDPIQRDAATLTHAVLVLTDFNGGQKSQRISPRCHPHQTISVTRRCVLTLKTWTSSKFLRGGVRLGACFRRETVTTDASLTGWGAVCQGRPAHGTWTEAQRGWHINRLELLAVFLALQHFSRLLNGRHVLVRTDNTIIFESLRRITLSPPMQAGEECPSVDSGQVSVDPSS